MVDVGTALLRDRAAPVHPRSPAGGLPCPRPRRPSVWRETLDGFTYLRRSDPGTSRSFLSRRRSTCYLCPRSRCCPCSCSSACRATPPSSVGSRRPSESGCSPAGVLLGVWGGFSRRILTTLTGMIALGRRGVGRRADAGGSLPLGAGGDGRGRVHRAARERARSGDHAGNGPSRAPGARVHAAHEPGRSDRADRASGRRPGRRDSRGRDLVSRGWCHVHRDGDCTGFLTPALMRIEESGETCRSGGRGSGRARSERGVRTASALHRERSRPGDLVFWGGGPLPRTPVLKPLPGVASCRGLLSSWGFSRCPGPRRVGRGSRYRPASTPFPPRSLRPTSSTIPRTQRRRPVWSSSTASRSTGSTRSPLRTTPTSTRV